MSYMRSWQSYLVTMKFGACLILNRKGQFVKDIDMLNCRIPFEHKVIEEKKPAISLQRQGTGGMRGFFNLTPIAMEEKAPEAEFKLFSVQMTGRTQSQQHHVAPAKQKKMASREEEDDEPVHVPEAKIDIKFMAVQDRIKAHFGMWGVE